MATSYMFRMFAEKSLDKEDYTLYARTKDEILALVLEAIINERNFLVGAFKDDKE